MRAEEFMAIAIEGAAPLLAVWDVPTSLKFWRDALGFDVVSHSPPFTEAKDDFGWCLLRLNAVEVMLNNAYENNVRPAAAEDAARVKVHGDTCLYFACRDVDAAYRALRAAGVAVSEPKVAYYGMKQIYMKDPDGYGVCFQWPAEKAGSGE
jgi:glyoxylase I family protein